MTVQGIHIHEPGRLSRWGVVDVGLKCVHSCQFCYYSFLDGSDDQFAGMRKAKFLPPEHLFALADSLAANGFLGFDVTGGEPGLHPAIVDLVAHARVKGLAARIITLGQYLMRPMKSAPGKARLIDGLIEAGVADFLLSVHGVTEESFRELTGESWERLLSAMTHLDETGFDYGTNTTVFESNFRQLPAIAREIARHRVYIANFIVMNAYYAWSRPGVATNQVQGHYSEIRPYLIEARDILEDAGIAVNLRYAPLCTMRGMERNLVGIVGVRHDPHEWMNQIDHMTPHDPAAMGRPIRVNEAEAQYPLQPVSGVAGVVAQRAGKLFPDVCKGCAAISVCDGLDPRYAQERGSSELQPYREFRGDLLDRDRLKYRAAFVVKTEGTARVRPIVNALLRGQDVATAVARAA